MKKLNKLIINPEKVIKNEELVNLRGGYGDHWVSCKDSSGSGTCGFTVPDCGDYLTYKRRCQADCGTSGTYVCV